MRSLPQNLIIISFISVVLNGCVPTPKTAKKMRKETEKSIILIIENDLGRY
jgi:hypothetical protein